MFAPKRDLRRRRSCRPGSADRRSRRLCRNSSVSIHSQIAPSLDVLISDCPPAEISRCDTPAAAPPDILPRGEASILALRALARCRVSCCPSPPAETETQTGRDRPHSAMIRCSNSPGVKLSKPAPACSPVDASLMRARDPRSGCAFKSARLSANVARSTSSVMAACKSVHSCANGLRMRTRARPPRENVQRSSRGSRRNRS